MGVSLSSLQISFSLSIPLYSIGGFIRMRGKHIESGVVFVHRNRYVEEMPNRSLDPHLYLQDSANHLGASSADN
ncbi:hypothetical protein HZ326_20083 [Fusarium oxysporum f. sp. albedinis]|nr:hypothetical protein HZ326_20083 [Fusarium oxysporum f. sp. albedinis]